MVSIDLEYQGDLHCQAVHGPSRTALTTDAPKDNHGRGETFSPTDLVATALGSCMLTTMGILARTLSVDMAGATATVEKEMTSTPPRMVHQLTVKIHTPHAVSQEDQPNSNEPPSPVPSQKPSTRAFRFPPNSPGDNTISAVADVGSHEPRTAAPPGCTPFAVLTLPHSCTVAAPRRART